MGLLDKALSDAKKNRKSLLEEARNYFLPEQTYDPEIEALFEDEEVIQSSSSLRTFQESINQLSDSIIFPFQALNALNKGFSFQKTALLVPVNNQYVPISTFGLDITTQRKLIIPEALIDSKNIQVIDFSSGNSSFQPYFSIREFSSICKMHVLPVSHNNKVLCVLLIADESLCDMNNKIQDILLESISGTISPRYLSFNLLKPLLSRDTSSDDFDIFLSRQQKPSKLIYIDFEDMISLLSRELYLNDDFPVINLLRSIFLHLIPGDYCFPDARSIVLSMPDSLPDDDELLHLHIHTYLSSTIKGVDDLPTGLLKIKSYPDEGDTFETLFAD